MHITILFLAFWALAFVTLCAALVLLNIFYSLTENDLELHSISKELAIAGIASFVEGTGVWLIVLFIPIAYRALGLRALIIPAIVVALIYKIAHIEVWSHYDALFLLIFQLVIGCLGASLILAHFQAAITILVGFVAILTIIGSFVRGL